MQININPEIKAKAGSSYTKELVLKRLELLYGKTDMTSRNERKVLQSIIKKHGW